MFTGLESPTHLLIVLVIVLLLFGGKRIPELAKGLGTGVREFRKSFESGSEEDEKEEDRKQRLEAGAEDGRSENTQTRDTP
jgi:sec-independent protein translocase protein TatA